MQRFLKPQLIIVLITLLILAKIILIGRLVYGDIPLFDIHKSNINFMYVWGPEQMGTNVRQSLNTIRDELFKLMSVSNYMYYFLKYVLPLILIPLTYFYILSRLGLRNKLILIVSSLFPLFTPIVFGDFLNGQTFWIYLTVPWVYYFTIKIFGFERFAFRNYLLLGLWLFLSLGALPPVIVPLSLIVAIIVFVAFFINYGSDKKIIFRYIYAGAVSLAVFVLLAMPYLFAASSGQSVFTPASLLGDYHHNYLSTELINTLRVSGNNGSGQKTLNYNNPALTNTVGYIFIALVVVGALMGKGSKGLNARRTVLCLLVPMLTILGFMHLMATEQAFGMKVFESQWVVSTIRNPSKLYLLILPFLTLLLAIAINNYLKRYTKKQHYVALGAFALVLLMTYGWPALRGDLGLLYGREDKLSSYKPDEVVSDMASKVSPNSRSLLAPANHRDELNYQNTNPGFNVLRLEGGSRDTTAYISNMKNAFNDQNRYFFNYMSASSIENLFIKKDPKAYSDTLFGLFSVEASPIQAHDFASKNLLLKDETKTYWHFANPNTNQLVYSPRGLVDIKGADSLQTDAPFLGKDVGVINNGALGRQAIDYATLYSTREKLNHNEKITKGKAQLHDPSLLLTNLYAQNDPTGRKAIFEVLNPVTKLVEKTYQTRVGDQDSVVAVGSEKYDLNSTKKTVTMRSGLQQITSSRLEEVDSKDFDLSFEKNTPRAGDATIAQQGSADFSLKPSADSSDGKRSLQLSSKKHTAFIEIDIPHGTKKGEYLLSFDFKNLKGDAPSYAILKDNEPIAYGGAQSSENSMWQSNKVYFDYDPQKGQDNALKVYFYTAPDLDGESINLFDNAHLYNLAVGSSANNVSFQNYEPDYQLTDYVNKTDEGQTANLLDDGSFERKDSWGGVRDATISAKGSPKVISSQSSDSTEGTKSLKLESHNHTAYVSKRAKTYKSNTVYKLSFFYKNVSGRNPSFAIWQYGSNIAQPSKELKAQPGDWQYFETYFIPDHRTTNLAVYLYSPSIGEHTVNLFDEVRLETTSLVSTYFSQDSTPTRKLANIVDSYKRVSPTEISVQVRSGVGALAFNESFQKGWQAYIAPADYHRNPGYKLLLKTPAEKILNHAMINGFANGWWLDSSQYKSIGSAKTYEVVLLYTPQKRMFEGMIISGATSIVIASYFAVNHWYVIRDEKKIIRLSERHK